MGETCVAGAVSDFVRHVVAQRQRRGRPVRGGRIVAQVDQLARPVGDRVVAPGRETVLLAIDGPGKAKRGFGHEAAEPGVGDDVDPRQRRRAAGAELDHVLTRGKVEAAQTVEEGH